MEHFYLPLTVSIYFVVALGLPGRLKAALHWETLRCAGEGTRHTGKLRYSELNNEARPITQLSQLNVGQTLAFSVS